MYPDFSRSRLQGLIDAGFVKVNGEVVDTLWATPYQTDITPYLRRGSNTIAVEVTSTWFNRLVYDAAQPKEQRRTWVINGPAADAPLRPSGLLGPVEILRKNDSTRIKAPNITWQDF